MEIKDEKRLNFIQAQASLYPMFFSLDRECMMQLKNIHNHKVEQNSYQRMVIKVSAQEGLRVEGYNERF